MLIPKIDIEDLALAKALYPDLSVEVIAEKLEVPVFALAQDLLGCDFGMYESLFNSRLERGVIRFNQEEMEIERCCSRCKQYLPYTKEFWGVRKDSRDGAHKSCRFCESKRKRISRAKLAQNLH